MGAVTPLLFVELYSDHWTPGRLWEWNSHDNWHEAQLSQIRCRQLKSCRLSHGCTKNAFGNACNGCMTLNTTRSLEIARMRDSIVVKAVRGMNVQICTKASNLVHRYILTCWTRICQVPKPIFNGVAILDDSKWPPSENTFLHFWPTNSHRITNKTTFLGFFGTKEPNSDMWMTIALTMGGPVGCFKMATIKIHILAYLTNKKW